MIHPKIFKESGTRLYVADEQLEQLIEKPQAILWNRDGMYGLVPLPRVKNAVINLNDCNKHRAMLVGVARLTSVVFTWGETEEIPPETGKTLERDG